MPNCLFASDLHGDADRYTRLLDAIRRRRPAAVFLGGDLLPPGLGGPATLAWNTADFFDGFLLRHLSRLRSELGAAYPRVFVIPGNDDHRSQEAAMLDLAARGLWEYVHLRSVNWEDHTVAGYACIPPSPFQLKDWERYDVSRFVDPGCVSPEEGRRSVPAQADDVRYGTIERDLERLLAGVPAERLIALFHAPPYNTALDRAALDGRVIDHVPLDTHVGSLAIRRAIESLQPLLTLHGHVHEAPRLTGAWRVRIGRTHCLTAAHDGPELALIEFDPRQPESATRELL
ncbi:MAG TPA: metallophosphoesterase [Phycisphaerae bacterium]|nr:metallophosphoesterase [Phycisphaerae bacterium]